MKDLGIIFGSAIISILVIVVFNIISGYNFTYLYFGFPLILVNLITLYICRGYKSKRYLTIALWSQFLVFILFSVLFISDDYNHVHSLKQFKGLSFVAYLLNPKLGLFDEFKTLLYFNLPFFLLATAISYAIKVKLLFSPHGKIASDS